MQACSVCSVPGLGSTVLVLISGVTQEAVLIRGSTVTVYTTYVHCTYIQCMCDITFHILLIFLVGL